MGGSSEAVSGVHTFPLGLGSLGLGFAMLLWRHGCAACVRRRRGCGEARSSIGAAFSGILGGFPVYVSILLCFLLCSLVGVAGDVILVVDVVVVVLEDGVLCGVLSIDEFFFAFFFCIDVQFLCELLCAIRAHDSNADADIIIHGLAIGVWRKIFCCSLFGVGDGLADVDLGRVVYHSGIPDWLIPTTCDGGSAPLWVLRRRACWDFWRIERQTSHMQVKMVAVGHLWKPGRSTLRKHVVDMLLKTAFKTSVASPGRRSAPRRGFRPPVARNTGRCLQGPKSPALKHQCRGESDDKKPRRGIIDVMTSEGEGAIFPSSKKAKQDEGGAVQRAEGTRTRQGDRPEATVREGSGFSAAATRPRFPPYPRTGKVKDLRKWQKECAEIRKFYANDPGKNLPTRREPKDPDTTDAVQSPRDKVVVRRSARAVVSVSSITHDGQRLPQCTGIIIKQFSDSTMHRRAIIVTCSRVVSKAGKKLDPLPKLSVGLPDKKTVLDAELIYFNDHYDIALLHVSLDFSCELPSIGRGPEYGQEVFVLARDEDVSLRARRGNIMWLEESDILRRNYYMFLSCEIPEGGSGGMVIDHNGEVRGMAFHCGSEPGVLSISTVVTCLDMFMQFSRVARPVLGFDVRTIALLDVELQEEISDIGIESGFIVDMDALTLPELEDYLLSFGWEYLRDKSISTKDLKLKVCDLKSSMKGDITLPVRFCDAAERG